MNPHPPSLRLRALVDRRLSGTISRVELAELEELLLTPPALDYYLRSAEIEAGLLLLARRGDTAGHSPRSAVRLPSDSRHLLAASVGTLLLLLTAISAFFLLRSPSRPAPLASPPPPLAATLLRHLGPPGSHPDLAARWHVGHTLDIPAGIAELETPGRSSILVEGPARLQFLGPDQLRLEVGRVVVRTNTATTRFRLETPHVTLESRHGEFATAVDPAGDLTLAGVLEGRASTRAPSLDHPLVLERHHVAEFTRSKTPRPIAFDLGHFQLRFPSREFAWSAPPASFEPATIEHDLTGLVWGPGHYAVHFKWMQGTDALLIHRCELLLDGQPVGIDTHPAIAGDRHHTDATCFRFELPAGRYQRGRWTLRSLVQINPRARNQVQITEHQLELPGTTLSADDPRLDSIRTKVWSQRPASPDSQGLLFVEPGPPATLDDACGRWEYTHEGRLYRRTFVADGSARFEEDGIALPTFDRSRWTLEDGVIVLTIHDLQSGAFECVERHLVRSDGTLIFLDRPYRDAVKLPWPGP